MLPATILGTAHVLPDRRFSTAHILAQTARTDDPADVVARTGIHSRGWFEPGTRAGLVGAQVVRAALEQAGLAPGDLRRVIFVNSTGGDALIPATVNAVLDELGVRDTCDGFDLNNSCLGLLTAFDLAARSVATGLHPVAIVSVEIQSPFLTPDDPRPWLVLADAAACVVLGRPESGAGVLASHLANDGSLRGSVAMVHPGLGDQPARIRFTDTHKRMSSEAVDFLATSARRVVEAAGTTLDAIDWFVPHQPNGSMLARAIEVLGIGDRCLPIVHETGAIGSASLGVSLDRLRRSGRVKPGQRLLFVGVGAGVGYGALLYQEAPAPDLEAP